MRIYLLRHGAAESRRPGGTDRERALTAEGREALGRVLARARAGGAAPSLILCSPLARAVETARMAAEALGYSGEIVRTEALLPEADPAGFWDELRARRDEPAILAAGHEPFLSAAAAYLLGAPGLGADVRTATLLRLDLDRFSAPRAVLKWMLPPDVC
ncbi:MAG: histidine phosphatase family protein [Bryobacteraceae bacterium]